MEKKSVYVPIFHETLEAFVQTVTPAEADHLNELLRVCSASYGQSYRLQKHAELKEAESTVDHLKQRKAEQEGFVAAAEKRLTGLPEGGWVVGLVFIAGFASCFGAE